MSSGGSLELRVEARENAAKNAPEGAQPVRLVSPDVGTLTDVVANGVGVQPGQRVGALVQLGRSRALVVPEGVYGVIVSTPPRAVHAPVGFGDTVVEVDTSGAAAQRPESDGAAADGASAGLVVRCRQSGRFYRRTAPGEPALVEVGSVLEAGAPLGLIEVMKTFGHLHYQPQGSLPGRARVVRVLIGDGVDVEEGTPLFEVETA